MSLRICIVTWAHVCNNPRVVKEADALAQAGHVVRVIAHDADPAFAARDARLMESRVWRLETMPVGRHLGRGRWMLRRMAQRVAQAAFDLGLRTPRIRDLALNPLTAGIARLAAAAPADLVIGHNLRALPAAAHAAAALDALLGFDCEDLHLGELPDTSASRRERDLVRAVEGDYLPKCDRLTASSEGIARAVGATYGLTPPCVILNSSPVLATGQRPSAIAGRAARPISLYWFSQVIGPNRGIEEAIEALALVGQPATLSLRGLVSPAYRATLEALASRRGVLDAIRFMDHAPPEDLVRLAAAEDIGLAAEPGFSANNRLAASNKLFTYMAAGCAILASDTPGQRAILEPVGMESSLYRAGDPLALSEAMLPLFVPENLAAAKARSIAAAEGPYAWSVQATRLVDYLTTGVTRAAGAGRTADDGLHLRHPPGVGDPTPAARQGK